MINLLLYSIKSLESRRGRIYSGIAFDGRYIYTCAEDIPGVFRFDMDGNKKGICSTEYKYKSLCCDEVNKCLWALPAAGSYICKLDADFCEIERKSIKIPGKSSMRHISIRPTSGTLLICRGDGVYELGEKRIKINPCATMLDCEDYQSAAEVNGYLVSAGMSKMGSDTIIRIYRGKYAENLACLPVGHMVKGMCPFYENEVSGLYILTTKDNTYTCLLEYRFADINLGGDMSSYSKEIDLSGMTCIKTVTVNDTDIKERE